jgi:predicted transcriptional regulator
LTGYPANSYILTAIHPTLPVPGQTWGFSRKKAKSQVVIDLLANGLALEERRDDGMKHQSLNLGQSEADKTNQKDSAEFNKLWSELEALKQQMAQLHARQLQCETTRDRFAALEASLLGSVTRSN